MRQWCKYRRRYILLFVVAFFTLICSGSSPAAENTYSFPEKKVHPLPSSLLQWQDPEKTGDYFDRIEPTPLGYLIWSKFPVKIYFDRPLQDNEDNSASEKRFQQWVEAVDRAVSEWNEEIPLKTIEDRELADITVDRAIPKITGKIDPETGLFDLAKARSAVTSYEFYLSSDRSPILSHRMKIEINPGQSTDAILAAARHELGHALGIWGHSSQDTDIMFYSQTPNLVSISSRDINTLKKIYQQPTQLGWRLNSKHQE